MRYGCNFISLHGKVIFPYLFMKQNLCVRLDYCSRSFMSSLLLNYTAMPFAMQFCSTFYYWCWTWLCDLLGQWNVRICDGSRGIQCVWVTWLHLLSFCNCQNETCDEDLNITCVLELSPVNSAEPNQSLMDPDEISKSPFTHRPKKEKKQ